MSHHDALLLCVYLVDWLQAGVVVARVVVPRDCDPDRGSRRPCDHCPPDGGPEPPPLVNGLLARPWLSRLLRTAGRRCLDQRLYRPRAPDLPHLVPSPLCILAPDHV